MAKSAVYMAKSAVLRTIFSDLTANYWEISDSEQVWRAGSWDLAGWLAGWPGGWLAGRSGISWESGKSQDPGNPRKSQEFPDPGIPGNPRSDRRFPSSDFWRFFVPLEGLKRVLSVFL